MSTYHRKCHFEMSEKIRRSQQTGHCTTQWCDKTQQWKTEKKCPTSCTCVYKTHINEHPGRFNIPISSGLAEPQENNRK